MTYFNIRSIFLGASVFGFPLITSLMSLSGVVGNNITLLFRALVVLLALVVMLLTFKVKRSGAMNLFTLLFILFWSLYLSRVGWDVTFDFDELVVEPITYFSNSVGVCLIPALAAFHVVRYSEEERFLKRLVLISGMVLLVTLGAAIRADFLSLTSFSKASRLAHEYLNPISLGHLALSVMILSTCLSRSGGASMLTRSFFWLGVVGLIWSNSRGPIFSGLLIYTLIYRDEIFNLGNLVRLRNIVTSVLLLITLYLLLDFYFASEYSQRVMQLQAITADVTVQGRFDRIEGALSQFSSSPLIGDFIEERGSGQYPHNLFVEALMALGLVGFSILSAMLLLSAKFFYGNIQRGQHSDYLAYLFFQYFISAQFSGALYNISSFWIFMVLNASVYIQRGQK